MYKNPRITDRSIALVRAHCPNLETLHMRYCIGISGVAFCSEILWRDHELPPNSANKNDKPNKPPKKQGTPPFFSSLPFFSFPSCFLFFLPLPPFFFFFTLPSSPLFFLILPFQYFSPLFLPHFLSLPIFS